MIVSRPGLERGNTELILEMDNLTAELSGSNSMVRNPVQPLSRSRSIWLYLPDFNI